MTANDVEILARTIYGEARGEYKSQGGLASLIAVGNVVMNRLEAGGWYGKTISEVCRKPRQFSCWNQGDPNLPIVMGDLSHDALFPLCREIALKVLQKQWPDLTKGSNHYHASTMPVFPRWVKGVKPQVCIGRHIFYQLKGG